jgi:hypothetical protein
MCRVNFERWRTRRVAGASRITVDNTLHPISEAEVNEDSVEVPGIGFGRALFILSRHPCPFGQVSSN